MKKYKKGTPIENGWYLAEKEDNHHTLLCYHDLQKDAPLPNTTGWRIPLIYYDPKLKRFWCNYCQTLASESVTYVALLAFVNQRNKEYNRPDNEPTN